MRPRAEVSTSAQDEHLLGLLCPETKTYLSQPGVCLPAAMANLRSLLEAVHHNSTARMMSYGPPEMMQRQFEEAKAAAPARARQFFSNLEAGDVDTGHGLWVDRAVLAMSQVLSNWGHPTDTPPEPMMQSRWGTPPTGGQQMMLDLKPPRYQGKHSPWAAHSARTGDEPFRSSALAAGSEDIAITDLTPCKWHVGRHITAQVVAFNVDFSLLLRLAPLDDLRDEAKRINCSIATPFHKGKAGGIPVDMLGRVVTIRDPYVRFDMGRYRNIRIDSFNDILLHPKKSEVEAASCVKHLERAKADGDAAIREGDFATAIAAYTAGTAKNESYPHECFTLSTATANALTSAASAFRKAGDDAKAVVVSAAALFLEPENTTAFECYQSAFRTVAQANEGGSAIKTILSAACDVALASFEAAGGKDPDVKLAAALAAAEKAMTAANMAAASGTTTAGELAQMYLAAARISGGSTIGRMVSNTSLACTNLGLWHCALSTATAAAILAPGVAHKNICRAAIAAAHMGMDYSMIEGALASVEAEALRAVIDPAMKTAAAAASMRSNGSEVFDIDAISTGTAAPTAEFVAPQVAVRAVAGKGRGVFATDDVAAGSLLFYEPSFVTALSYSSEEMQPRMTYSGRGTIASSACNIFFQLQQLARLPCAAFINASLNYLVPFSGAASLLGSPPLDAERPTCEGFVNAGPLLFHDSHVPQSMVIRFEAGRAFEALVSNHFGSLNKLITPTSSKREGGRLFVAGSMLNHDPLPNATHFLVGEALTVRATRPIKKGEEVTIAYIPIGDYTTEMNPLTQFRIPELVRTDAERKAAERLTSLEQGAREHLVLELQKNWANGVAVAKRQFDIDVGSFDSVMQVAVLFGVNQSLVIGDPFVERLLQDPRCSSVVSSAAADFLTMCKSQVPAMQLAQMKRMPWWPVLVAAMKTGHGSSDVKMD